ncbi:metallophosphoesterase family protein [Halohasta litorea]|uniref:Exonuclease SbcCD subunit D n=1 Tax=Halohasta litorea TaxID=869891 RepID=A0ABD6D6C8_9EURY|nr:metallophosphoesterase [Halohasta litorea]
MAAGNELTEFYDCLSVLYGSLPSGTDSEWKQALKSVLYGGELLADEASCYGKQQNKRNHGKRKDHARQYGNGDRVTEFSAITVAEPRPEDKRYVPSGAVLPVAPNSEEVLPVKVTGEEIDRAISLLAEFPAEPTADRPGNGVNMLLDPDRVHHAQKSLGRGADSDETAILFVSDTHFGYENRITTGSGKTVQWIYNLSSVDTAKRVVEIAIDRDVDAVIHTGDILDHEVDADTLSAAAFRLELLSERRIPVYCIIGSHDHTSYEPMHSKSVNGIAWLKEQIQNGRLTELSTSPTSVADGPVDAYGISAGNVGIDDVGKFHSRKWTPSDIEFEAASTGPNVLCLHDGVTPYRGSDADVNIDRLLAESRVSFDCVLVGDEHRPKNNDFDSGYVFETADGTPVLYTGPAARISSAYRDHSAFVTEITISVDTIETKQHEIW